LKWQLPRTREGGFEMIALLIAAQVAAAPIPTPVSPTPTMRIVPWSTTMPDLRYPFAVPVWCRDELQRTARKGTTAPQRLGDLPRANLEYAVDRRIAGCPVPTPVRNGGGPIRSR
jgi:hypothetical protein